eukprot:11169722-Lingulodinium_polyedra.AAC.1
MKQSTNHGGAQPVMTECKRGHGMRLTAIFLRSEVNCPGNTSMSLHRSLLRSRSDSSHRRSVLSASACGSR